MSLHIWYQYLEKKVWCGRTVEYNSTEEVASWQISQATCLECWENLTLTIGVEEEDEGGGFIFDPRPTNDE